MFKIVPSLTYLSQNYYQVFYGFERINVFSSNNADLTSQTSFLMPIFTTFRPYIEFFSIPNKFCESY